MPQVAVATCVLQIQPVHQTLVMVEVAQHLVAVVLDWQDQQVALA